MILNPKNSIIYSNSMPSSSQAFHTACVENPMLRTLFNDLFNVNTTLESHNLPIYWNQFYGSIFSKSPLQLLHHSTEAAAHNKSSVLPYQDGWSSPKHCVQKMHIDIASRIGILTTIVGNACSLAIMKCQITWCIGKLRYY